MNLEIPRYLYALEDPFKISCFVYLDSKKIKKDVLPKLCWINTHRYTNILFKNHVTNSEKAFIYEERHSIDKSLSSEVSSSSSLRSPIDRCFIKANAFSDFRFEYKIDKFCKHF